MYHKHAFIYFNVDGSIDFEVNNDATETFVNCDRQTILNSCAIFHRSAYFHTLSTKPRTYINILSICQKFYVFKMYIIRISYVTIFLSTLEKKYEDKPKYATPAQHSTDMYIVMSVYTTK
jgi:hypothetical protein